MHVTGASLFMVFSDFPHLCVPAICCCTFSTLDGKVLGISI